MWYEGLLAPTLLQLVLITLVLTHVTIVAVTVYLHRFSAHRALDLHPALQHFFRFWLWLTTGMGTREWTAIHRKHHATCETEDDPHSPQIKGLKKVFWQGAELYREGKDPATLAQYGKGCPDDWMERNVYRHSVLGVSVMMAIDLLLFGAAGLTVWAVQMMWIPFWAAGFINGVGHYWGYRNFECQDAATNILPWGILIGGEELHNNHHTYPNSAKLSQKPWEFDIGWMYIRIFEMLGLAKARSRGPVVARDPAKQTLDLDSAWALLNDRFRVMSRYAEDVVAPLVRQERERASATTRHMLRKAKRVLCREETLIDDREQQRLQAVLETSPTLRIAYEKRMALQAIWRRQGESIEGRLEALKHWCAEAEASGIQALKDFAEELRSYTIPRREAATA